jgi:hypothetical protein
MRDGDERSDELGHVLGASFELVAIIDEADDKDKSCAQEHTPQPQSIVRHSRALEYKLDKKYDKGDDEEAEKESYTTSAGRRFSVAPTLTRPIDKPKTSPKSSNERRKQQR